VRGAFLVSDPARVTATHVLIVDDILTTGATARAAAQALVQAGAASVWVATLARAQRGERFGSTSVYGSLEEEEPLAGASAADLDTASFSTTSFGTHGSALEKSSF
jgi:orotate phosphoribosyltransferase